MKQKQKQKKTGFGSKKEAVKDTSTIVSTLQIQLRLKSKPVLHRKLELTGWLKAGPSKHVKGHGHICIFRCMVPLHENLTAYFWHTTT